MPRGGPPPQPTALRVLRGNPGKRPLNQNEARPPRVMPECPTELAPAARAEWDRIAPLLHEIGLLTQIDGGGLAAYCTLYARWLEAEAQIQKFGMLIKSPNGYLMGSPYLNVATQCLKQMRGYLQELGLSPSSRSRIQVGASPEALDDEERFFGAG